MRDMQSSLRVLLIVTSLSRRNSVSSGTDHPALSIKCRFAENVGPDIDVDKIFAMASHTEPAVHNLL